MIKWFKRWLSGAGRSLLPVSATEFTEEWADQLIDYWGKPVELADRRILCFGGKRWFLKNKDIPESFNRDRLAYLLGQHWANVAEVQPLHGSQIVEVRRHLGPMAQRASTSNTYLVRLVQDYDTKEFVHPDLDEAVASELVFSLWIRRRDAHASNRAYVNGVPMFFDHETAFLGEPELSDVDVFFLDGNDSGYAGNWRVKACAEPSALTTLVMRRLCKLNARATHHVRDMRCFDKGVDRAVSHILSQDPLDWYCAAREAGYQRCRAREVAEFLKKNSLELETSLQKMRDVILRD